MNFKFRLADLSYSNKLKEFYKLTVEENYKEMFDKIWINKEKRNGERYIDKIKKDKFFKIFLILKNEKIIGCLPIKIYKDENKAYLGDFLIEKKYQQKGLGSNLLSKSFNYLKKFKVKKIFLVTFKKQKRAINFYKKHGFIIQTEFYIKGSDDLVIGMSKDLY